MSDECKPMTAVYNYTMFKCLHVCLAAVKGCRRWWNSCEHSCKNHGMCLLNSYILERGKHFAQRAGSRVHAFVMLCAAEH